MKSMQKQVKETLKIAITIRYWSAVTGNIGAARFDIVNTHTHGIHTHLQPIFPFLSN